MSQRRLIALMGEARCGKTTVSRHLQTSYGYTEISFSDSLKEIVLKALESCPPPKFHSLLYNGTWEKEIYEDRTSFTRWLLQFVGTDIFRNQVRQTFWTDKWTYHAEELFLRDGKIVVPDLRFLNEVQAVRQIVWPWETQIWLIKRTGLRENIEYGPDHISEQEWKQIEPDVVIEAPDGIEHLHRAVDKQFAWRR